ncbi:glycosyltransferase family 2 protein [Haloferax marisrubri]|uniref:Glycosyltransferase family 2 protein n=1 Tax=Haloferax marisrubri TaxID=1544719 RepID=A0A2P4NQV8_9EURY|nr:glycosyltransferase family 2 protein [Haloferax marisrubri]POG55524.1 glycosyltransferase family 2 protein [Haloferax marisrubri]
MADSNTERISIIIATKDRETDLKRCIDSISNQTTSPGEVIIVDDGNIESELIDSFNRELPNETNLIVTDSEGPPGLSVARNTGIRAASGEIVLTLDDDAEIGTDYLQRVQSWFREVEDPNFVGVAGFDDRLREVSEKERIIRKLLLLEEGGWKINKVGIQSRSVGIDRPTKADWMPGYNFAYRRDVIIDHLFPQYNGGREALEDIAVGWELSKEGKYCIIDPDLPVRHYDPPKQDSGYEIGVKHGQNRVRYFKKYGTTRHWPLFLWAMVGVLLLEVLAPLFTNRLYFHWTKAVGILVGVGKKIPKKVEEPIR